MVFYLVKLYFLTIVTVTDYPVCARRQRYVAYQSPAEIERDNAQARRGRNTEIKGPVPAGLYRKWNEEKRKRIRERSNKGKTRVEGE